MLHVSNPVVNEYEWEVAISKFVKDNGREIESVR